MSGTSRPREALRLLCRVALGAVFVLSAVSKLISPESFEAVLRQHQALPGAWVLPFAHVLPWVELLSGTFLLLGLFTRTALAAVGVQLVVFIGALASALARGIDLTDCGCFAGFGIREPLPVALARDAALLALAVWLWKKPAPRFTLDRWLGEG